MVTPWCHQRTFCSTIFSGSESLSWFSEKWQRTGNLLIPACLIPPLPSPTTIAINISFSTPLSFGARSDYVKGHWVQRWVLWSVLLLCDEKGKHQGQCYVMSQEWQPLHSWSSSGNRKCTDVTVITRMVWAQQEDKVLESQGEVTVQEWRVIVLTEILLMRERERETETETETVR